MEIFFRKHIEGFLVAFAIVLIAAMVGCFAWSMTYISESLDAVFEPRPNATQMIGFDLSGAQSLNLRGLVSQP
jgi:hypothetical protein